MNFYSDDIIERVNDIEVDVSLHENKIVNISITNGNTSIGSLTINTEGSITFNSSLSTTARFIKY